MGLPASARTTLAASAASGRMPVDVFVPEGAPAGLAVVAHGRNGAPGQAHMRGIIEACLGRRLRVVAPHLSNSAGGEAAGAPSRFTLDGHCAELRDVAHWARMSVPSDAGRGAILVGHSMGAYAALWLAARSGPDQVAGVVAVSPVASGAALLAARQRMGAGAIEALAAELPGAFREWRHHDLMPVAGRVAVPVALITGWADTLTPPEDAAALAALLPHVVMLATLPGQHHCPAGPDVAHALGQALDRVIAARRWA